MARSFKNITLRMVSALLMLVFIACLVALRNIDLNLGQRTAVIGTAILSFFASLYLLMLIRTSKRGGE